MSLMAYDKINKQLLLKNNAKVQMTQQIKFDQALVQDWLNAINTNSIILSGTTSTPSLTAGQIPVATVATTTNTITCSPSSASDIYGYGNVYYTQDIPRWAAKAASVHYQWSDLTNDCDWELDPPMQRVVGPKELHLPDGTRIHVDADGNFRIEDKDAKVTYEANRHRAFNPYVNAGDVMARFIDYVRGVPGVRREDVATLPLELFVHWLILEAASRDGDPAPADVVPPEDSKLLRARTEPRCALPTCRRYIRRASARAGFNYCAPRCAERHHLALTS